MSLLDGPIRALHKTLLGVAGEKVTYTENGGDTYKVVAILGKQTTEETSIDGSFMEDMELDFIVPVNDMRNLPNNGDVIQRKDGKQYRVLSIANEPQWRYTDQTQLAIRIHTKQRN